MVKIPQNIYLSNVLNSLENLKKAYWDFKRLIC